VGEKVFTIGGFRWQNIINPLHKKGGACMEEILVDALKEEKGGKLTQQHWGDKKIRKNKKECRRIKFLQREHYE